MLGQAVVLVTYASDNGEESSSALLEECKRQLPGFMVPVQIIARREPLPRNPNGKIDRKRLAGELSDMFHVAG
jgi:acyl-CoA synthetase (AMP-forming)/AMP-acid ligase II